MKNNFKIYFLFALAVMTFIVSGCSSSPRTDQNFGKSLKYATDGQIIKNKDSNGEVTSKELKGVLDNYYSTNGKTSSDPSANTSSSTTSSSTTSSPTTR